MIVVLFPWRQIYEIYGYTVVAQERGRGEASNNQQPTTNSRQREGSSIVCFGKRNVKIVNNSLVKNTSLLDYFLHYLMFCKSFLQKLQIEDNFKPICFQFCKPSGIFIFVMQISVLPIQSNPVLLCRNLFQFNTSKKLLIHLNKKENENR